MRFPHGALRVRGHGDQLDSKSGGRRSIRRGPATSCRLGNTKECAYQKADVQSKRGRITRDMPERRYNGGVQKAAAMPCKQRLRERYPTPPLRWSLQGSASLGKGVEAGAVPAASSTPSAPARSGAL
jgi:hypothetical protein